MTKKDTIYVSADGIIDHELSGYILRLPKLMTIGAVKKHGRLHYELVNESLIDNNFVEVVHLKTKSKKGRVLASPDFDKMTKKQLVAWAKTNRSAS